MIFLKTTHNTQTYNINKAVTINPNKASNCTNACNWSTLDHGGECMKSVTFNINVSYKI